MRGAAEQNRAADNRAAGYRGDGNSTEKVNNDGPTDTSFKHKLGLAYNAVCAAASTYGNESGASMGGPGKGPFVDPRRLSAPGAGGGPKGSLLESLFFSASQRLRAAEDEEDSHSQTSCTNSNGSGRSPAASLSLLNGAAYPVPQYLGPHRTSTSHYDFGAPSYPPAGLPPSLANGILGGGHMLPASVPPRSSLASLLDVARSKRSYEAALGGGGGGGEQAAQPVGHLGASAWGESSTLRTGAALLGMNGMTSPPMGLMEGPMAPAVRHPDDYAGGQAPPKSDASQSRRSQREALSSLTAEEKLERRKERARMYSHIARKRQESHMRELKAEVESLTVYRLMVEEAPDMVVVLSPDIESRFLFVNAVFARALNVTATALLGSSIWLMIHEEDKPLVIKVLGSIIMASRAPGFVRCRLKSSGYPDPYVTVDISMRYGRQGIICFLRPQPSLA